MSNSIGYYRQTILDYFTQRLGFYFAGALTFVISFFVIYTLGRVGIFVFSKLIDKLISKNVFFKDSNILDHGTRLLRKILLLTAIFGAAMLIDESPSLRLVIYKFYRVGMIILITNGIVNAMDVIFAAIGHVRKDKSEAVNETVMGFLSKMTKILIIILSVLMILSELGIDVNGIIAGLGLGGVTFALAAKDTATNMFGGINIIVDKPFVVGEWIETSTVEGVVEDITFRSTRIRTFFDSVIVVPNSTLSNDSITNWSRMNKRKDSITFGVSYNTEKFKIQSTLGKIENFLKSHDNILSDTVIVRLNNFAESSIEIYVVYFMDLLTFTEVKRIREEVSFGIIDVLNDEGVEFAFPSRTIYMAKDK